LAAYVPAAAVIAQMRVDAKTNEHKAALQLLAVLPLKGKPELNADYRGPSNFPNSTPTGGVREGR
jgi:hypothetical protein